MNPHRFHLLHLEDSVRDAQLIWDLLEDEGYEFDVVHATNKESFLAAFEKRNYDLILCDSNLPSYSAFAALDVVRSQNKITPFLIVSGTIGEEEAVKGLHKGATDYLLKGKLERLGAAVQRALDEAEEKRQRHHAEEELLRREERMRLALAATNDAIWDLDLSEDTLVANKVFRALFGEAPVKQSSDWLRSLLHPDDEERIVQSISAAIEKGDQFWAQSYRMRRKDGAWAHVQNRVCLSRDEGGHITRLVGAVQDMTEAIRAEEKRQALEEQLMQSQKMEAVGTLAGGIAHDFNNILGIILTNAELAQTSIQSGYPDISVLAECISETISAGDRARDLVRQILTFSRSGRVERKLLNPQGLLEECLRLLRSTLPAMVTLESEISPPVPAVMADATQLHQVLMNLCTNSWHALPDGGGKIVVALEGVRPDTIKFPDGVPAGDYVRIGVSDNGCGMPPDVIARIFEPFFTTKETGKGTGLGLSMVHGIVKEHEGFLHVESEEGVGTRFQIYLPAKAERPEETLESIAVSTRGRGQNILLLDDDASMAHASARVLKRSGYLVEVVNIPEAAIDLLKKDPERFDLMLTDYSMPGMSGVELAERVETIAPEMPIVLLSGLAEAGIKSRIRSTNIKKVVEKPIWPEVLCQALAQVFAEREEPEPETLEGISCSGGR